MQDIRHVLKELHRAVDCHVEHIGNAFSFESHFERFAVIAFAVTGFAGHIHIGKEVHLDGFVATAFTGFATPAAHIERKATGLVSTNFCFGQIDEELSNIVEYTGVGGGIRTRCATERTLVYSHHLIYMFQAFDALIFEGFAQGVIDVLRQNGVKCIVDEGRFARSRNARHTDERAEGKFYGDVLQIIAFRTDNAQDFAVAFTSLFGNGNAARAVQVVGSERLALEHLRRRALKHHFPTLSSGAGADVHHIIGGHHHVFVVLHHNHRVAGVAELLERANQSHIVALMETDRGFVENIEHIDQLRTDLRGESDALTLAARKGHRRAVEREVVESHIEEER